MKKFIFAIIFVFYCTAFSAFAQEEKLIIFDASASMNQPINGVPKYILAIRAAKTELEKIEQSEKIGLRTIGITRDADSILSFLANPSEMCKATQLAVPIKNYNTENIEAALNGIVPLGTTPLTYSLDTAIKYDFMYGSHIKHIILITDGGESCKEHPCEYIRDLMNSRQDIVIDIIAIGVRGKDFLQLKCLTDTTSGTIIPVNTPDGIENAFEKILNPDFDMRNGDYKTPQIMRHSREITVPERKKPASKIKYKNYLYETYD